MYQKHSSAIVVWQIGLLGVFYWPPRDQGASALPAQELLDQSSIGFGYLQLRPRKS